jgi:hypothetical protein
LFQIYERHSPGLVLGEREGMQRPIRDPHFIHGLILRLEKFKFKFKFKFKIEVNKLNKSKINLKL